MRSRRCSSGFMDSGKTKAKPALLVHPARVFPELEARGVILGYGARLDARAMGRGILAFSWVRQSPAAPTTDLAESFRELAEVEECHHIAVEADYLRKVRNRRHPGPRTGDEADPGNPIRLHDRDGRGPRSAETSAGEAPRGAFPRSSRRRRLRTGTRRKFPRRRLAARTLCPERPDGSCRIGAVSATSRVSLRQAARRP
jgi:hypothetical protein